jgi:hypothetical protein
MQSDHPVLEQARLAVRRSVAAGARGDGDMVEDTECLLCAHGVVGEVERDPFGEGRPPPSAVRPGGVTALPRTQGQGREQPEFDLEP